MDRKKSKKIRLTGVVVSDGGDKTAAVKVTLVKKDPKYGKQYTLHRKYAVHDEKNEAARDDVVEIEAANPRSKLKKWVLVRKVK